jgi:hypothetical protein
MNACEFSADLSTSKLNQFASWRGLLEFEKTLFVLVNVMDIVMTHLLLSTGAFYESNPIAKTIIDGWGTMGMTAFKLIVVAGVLLIANLVAVSRVKTSRNLLNFGTFMVGAVVTYSIYLLVTFNGFG